MLIRPQLTFKIDNFSVSAKTNTYSILVALITLFFTDISIAQTVLIDPNGDGGFENGTSFAANNWNVVNNTSGSNSNRRNWYVGDAQSGYTGDRCAFIGNNANNVGSQNPNRTVHFYRSITIPAGATNIQLSFKYKQATSDYSGSTYYDYIAVYTSNNAPTSGNLPTGTIAFGPYPNNNVTSFTTQNATLPNTLAGTTTNLIFTFRADDDDPNGYGAVDDISLTYTTACTTPTAQPTALTLNGITSSSINGSFTAASPAPDNYLVIRNTTGTAPTITNGTAYSIGQNLGSTNIVVDNDSNTTFSATGLSATTTYYFFVYAFNSNCSGGPRYRTTSPLTGNATTIAYCIPSSSSSNYYISSYRTTGAVTDAPTNNTGYSASGYGDYTSLTPVQQIPGGGVNVSLVLGGGTQTVRVWVDWNKNNAFEDATETVFSTNTPFISNTFGFVVPTGTAIGDYRMRIRSRSNSACGSNSDGETEDYTIRVIQDCPAKITSAPTVELCGNGAITLTVTGSSGTTGYRWYTTETGGSPIPGAATASYTTPSLNTTTTYYVTATNGSCESLVRTPIIAKIKPVPNITITPASPEICGDNDFVQISAAGSTEVVELLNETFEGSGLGAFTAVNISNGNSLMLWQQKTSVYTTVSNVWKPAISSGSIGNKFAFTTSDYSGSNRNMALQTTNSYNTTNFIDLTLSFRHYYSDYGTTDFAIIEVSTDNGANWSNLTSYTASQGSPGKFATVTIPLNSYVNVANLKFRFRYQTDFADGWAVDDVILYGTRPLTSNFTWSGATIDAYIDANGTTPYTNQAVNVVYIKPSTAQLEVNNWSFTANVQLTNGCTASRLVNVTNKSKVWQGHTGNWNDPNNWLPVGVPSSDNCVIIKPAGNYATINGTNYEAQAKTLTVRANARLEVPSNNGIKVVNKIDVQNSGILNLDNSASIVQVDNVANSGIVNIKRTTKPMYRFDFTYWNSPVTLASNYTLAMLSPNTLADKYMRWQPTVNGGYGNWVSVSSSTVMNPNMGYIVRAPQTFDSNPNNKATYTGTFTGTPNNGDISIPIAVGTDANVGGSVTVDDDQWNLIGNPYASAVDIVAFLNDTANQPLMDGTVYIWTHNTPLSNNNPNPFYGTYAFNYTSADYATVNKFGATATAGSGGSLPSQYVASGQSFFVKGLTNGNAKFANYMRVSGMNNNFMKSSGNGKSNPETQSVAGGEIERHRIWLNLANESGGFSQILVGYDAEATMDFDRGLDGQSFGGNAVTFYSIIPQMNLTIQARPMPFNVQDQIPLGFNANAQNTYQIGIDHVDGMFDTHPIYLEDKLLNVIHNLRTAPYSFSSVVGTFNDRFVLRFSDGTLGNDDFTADNGIKILRGSELAVHSSTEKIKNIIAYDVLGKKIDEYKNAGENQIVLKNVKKSTSVVLLKITLENGVIVDRKTIF